MRFSPLMLATLSLALIVGCDSEPKAWMPPHVVIVDDVSHDVELRRWCEQSIPCELMSRQDVYWQVEHDGQVKVMHIGEELRFQRGTFDRPHNGDPSWAADQDGEYLLATTDARRALIIHYPIKSTATVEDLEIIEESEPVEKLEVNERTDCPTTLIDEDLMNRTMTALLDESNKGKFLLWEQNYAGGDDPYDIRVVYVYQGVRYTVWHSPKWETMEPMLSVWERPNGTNDMDSLDTYTDTRMTGCVNFGIGSESSHGEDRRSMTWNDDIRDEEGLEHHAFWQGRYVFAIRGLADTLGVK